MSSYNQDLKTRSEVLLHYGASDLQPERIFKDISLEELLQLSVHASLERISFRASWALEHILLNDSPLLLQQQDTIISNYLQLDNWSSIRSYTKLLMKLLELNNTNKTTISPTASEAILEKTFAIVDNVACPVAVKVNAFDILFLQCKTYKWLANELKLQITFALEKDDSAALKSRGNRLLKKLERITQA